jgi:peptidoglycan hydrolase-like protein with peptidoglycan-binding domain
MTRSAWRWLLSAGAVAAVGASACLQVGTADAAGLATSGRAADAVHDAGTSRTAAAAYVPPKHNFNYGARGSAVRSIQRRLNKLHYYAGPVDGIYGQDLAEAVWAFKEAQGLPMNAATNTYVNWPFRRDLIHPKAPRVLMPKGPKNRVEVNQNDELLVLYHNNKVKLILHVSTGGGYYYTCPGTGGTCGPAVTPDGNYTAYAFNSGWLTVPLGTMYNPVWFSPGYAIHGDIPVPWYPASHGCVRIWMDAATWFHKDLSIGGRHPTHIYIRGTAPYQPSIVG